jgi:hypothetical protein
MGFYMGVFNFFITIPQILASVGLGTLMRHVLGGNPMNAVLMGGGSMILAGCCVGLVSREVDRFGERPGAGVPEDGPIARAAEGASGS